MSNLIPTYSIGDFRKLMVPELGEIRRGREIGKSSYASRHNFVWHACISCGKPRWVRIIKGKLRADECHTCALKNIGHKNFRCGIIYRDGYREILLNRDDFFFAMANQHTRYVKEHRLVMAKHLGRCLHPWEIVHHKNHDRLDNRIENLQLLSVDKHSQITLLTRRIKKLEDKIDEQSKLIKLLQWQIRQEVKV